MKKPKVIQIAYSANVSDAMPTMLMDDGRIFKWALEYKDSPNSSQWNLVEITPIIEPKKD